MQCPTCGTVNPAQARFCMGCGRQLVHGKVCQSCHTLLPLQAQYCFQCGSFVAQVGSAASVVTSQPPEGTSRRAVEPLPARTPSGVQGFVGTADTTAIQPTQAQVAPSSGTARVSVERPLEELRPSLRRCLTKELYEPLERRPKESDLVEVRNHLSALLATAKTYLPGPVIQNPQPAGIPSGKMYRGVFLFGDVSGFTPLSEKLKALGQAGAEQITRLINSLFTDLVTVLFDHGGTLLKFGGDALLGLFPAENDEELASGVFRAAQAAQAMQLVMKKEQYAQIEALGEKRALQIKCGISAGPYFAAHIGLEPGPKDANGTMAFVTTGETVNLAEEAEGHAFPGEVAMTSEAAMLMGSRAELGAVNKEPDEKYRRLVQIEALPPEGRQQYDQPELPDGSLMFQISYLVERLDLLTPYLSDELVARIVTNPKDARIVPEHRPVTVMFANYKGISRLIEKHGESEPGLITQHLNRYFAHMATIVEKYEGTLARMDQYAVGDRLVIFFGAPRAREDDPIRAVYTALEMQEAVRSDFSALRTSSGVYRFEQRIGINTGHLFAGNVGASDLRQEYTLMGDDINMAARLMSNAPWGQIYISHKTKDLVENYFELQDRGELKVKGKEIRIPTFSVVGRRGEVGKTRGLDSGVSPLIGREKIMELMQGCGQMFLHRRGQIIALVGNSGLGKTRLVQEFKTWLEQQPEASEILWIDGKALSFSEQMSYWVAGQMMRGLLNLRPGSNEDDVLYALGERGEELLGDDHMSAVPFLAHMLNLELGEEWAWVKKEDPKVRQKQTLWAAASFLGAAARQRPTVIALDDLHWADEASLTVIEHLLQVTDQAPLMLLLLFRPLRDKGCWKLRDRASAEYPHRYQEIMLDPLKMEESAELLVKLLPGAQLTSELSNEVLEKAAGNPYYLEEVVRSMIEGGAVIPDPGRESQWIVTDKVSQIKVPASLHAAIIARIDRLSEDTRQALQTAAVIGRQFQLKLFRNVAQAEAEIDIWMSQLERGGLILPMDVSLDPTYSFPDALVQEVAYDSLLVQSRKLLHRRLGEALETIFGENIESGVDLLAYHYCRSDEETKAIKYLEMAAKKARGDYAMETAIRYYLKLLEFLRRQDEVDNKPDQANALYQMGVMAYEMGDYSRAEPWFAEAEQLFRELNDDRNVGWTIMYLGMVDLKRGNYSSASAHHTEALEQARQRKDRIQEGIHLTNLARVTMRMGYYQRAYEMIEQSLASKREENDVVGQGFSYYYMGMVDLYRHKLEDAKTSFQNSIAMWEKVARNERGLAYCQQGLGLLALKCQAYEESLDHFQKALAMCEKLVLRAEMIENLSWISQVYLGLSRPAQALDASEKAIRLLITQKDVEEVQQIYLNHYFVLSAVNDPRADETLQKAVAIIHEQGMQIPVAADREVFLNQVYVNQRIQETVNLATRS